MPSRSTTLLMLFLAVVASLLGLNYFFQPFAAEPLPPVTLASPSPSPDAVTLLTADWPVEQKIAQVVAVPVEVELDGLDASSAATVAEFQPGFVTLFGSQISTTAAQLAVSAVKNLEVNDEAPIGLVVDHEGGTTQRLSGAGFTRLPSWRSLCAQPATVSAQLIRQSAQEISRAGIDVVLAPVIDVASSSATLGNRICSGDAGTVATNAEQYLSIMRQVNIWPVLKHFPGLGQTRRDLHFGFDQVTVDMAEAGLYRQLLDDHPETGVMVSHVGVENQYADLPCSLSADCVGELRSNYPDVLVFSDALEMAAAGYNSANEAEPKSLAQRSIEAVLAGNEVLIYGPQVSPTEMSLILRTMEQRYAADPNFAQAVDQHVEKVVRWKQSHL